jgi:hypothetical protein
LYARFPKASSTLTEDLRGHLKMHQVAPRYPIHRDCNAVCYDNLVCCTAQRHRRDVDGIRTDVALTTAKAEVLKIQAHPQITVAKAP